MSLYAFDREYRNRGYGLVCGVDEAGRGPLAGPVVAAAVILPPDCRIEGLDDSKKLTEKKREALYGEITRNATAYAVAQADEREIDDLNILRAAMLAMRRAVQVLDISPDCILVDGNSDPGVPGIHAHTVIGGDGKSACIAAASVLAKVSRDRMLVELDKTYPQYQFAKHKGYPTRLHYELLNTYGPCPAHRQSFLLKWKARNGAVVG